MYIIYKGANGVDATVNIDNQLAGETPDQMVQRYIDNGWVADLPWSGWFEVPADLRFYGAELLIVDWSTQTCILNQVAYTKMVQDEVLAQRSNLLQQSDWTQLPDVPEATKLAWQPYRQALRDIPTQSGYPFDVVWPTPPQP